MSTGKHGRLIDKGAGLVHDALVFCCFLWLCWSPGEPIRWATYLLAVCSALLVFRSRIAERVLVHRHPWSLGLLTFFDVIVLAAVLAMARDHLLQLSVAAVIWIAVRALLIPRAPALPRPVAKSRPDER